MLSGYAARDHRQIVIKQRRPDQGSRNKPSDGSYRVDSHQHLPQPILIGSGPLSRKDAHAIFSLLERR